MTGTLIDLVLHVDRSVAWIFHEWGWVAWALVFLIVFIETGVVVFPFLPGDSLLFACGAFSATQGEPVALFLILISVAALVGNTTNWLIGRTLGAVLLKPRPGKRPWIKPEHLEETHAFFERWGGWAVTLSRFFPIIRTITPFVAGVGRMSFGPFSFYNALGGIGWTVVFVLAGFFFGNLPWVKENFSLVVVALVLLPALPAFVGFLKTLKKSGPSEPSA
ncbi:MAG TPA: VTT domain-containing protein [Spirochaetia bacterium]|jgi:membrane-associated protein|nr:VTT domain-containing protein [Spirochaetia bacterium]